MRQNPRPERSPARGRLSLGVLLWLVSSLAATTPAHANTRLAIAEGVSVLMPSGFHYAVTRPSEGLESVTLFEVRDGDDVLVVVIYGSKGGKNPPSAELALEIHTAELAERLGQAVRSRREVAGLSLFGARRPTQHLHLSQPAERLAWVVAAELGSKGKAGGPELTVVCSALVVVGSPNTAAFTRMAESLMVGARKGAP